MCFLSSVCLAAAPATTPASDKMLDLSGEVMDISMAAGLSLFLLLFKRIYEWKLLLICLLPTVLYLTQTVYRERDRMAREFALTRAKLSLPKISLLTSDLGRPCLVDKWVASLDNA